jgi:hypothetical protein
MLAAVPFADPLIKRPTPADRARHESACCLVSVISIQGCQFPVSSSCSQWPSMLLPSSLNVPSKRSEWLRMLHMSAPFSSARLAS